MITLPTFSDFFEEVHGHAPFPWQNVLADRVIEEGWPSLLDLPTGAGKTSTLDIALYALAAAPDRAPRRVFLVVDRRIVVDQGARHARRILGRLLDGAAPGVTAALRALSGAGDREDPFHVAVLRGGMPGDSEWARRPDQPVLGLSTVDQVGSRLLFRGYGLSDRMAPVHAGLVGNDVLFLLDEVHLARPFADTLGAVADRWRRGSVERRFAFVRMSATPGEDTQGVFRLGDADREHPRLKQRLAAEKPARLEEVKVSGDEPARRSRFAVRCAEEAVSMVNGGASVVAVVVNRVETARAVWRRIVDRSATEVEAVLVTGRMRPLDRDLVLHGPDGVLARAGADGVRASRPCPRPLVLVATQCIEAGADLDFDGLVTECASLDALRQRFGRLDRKGDYGRASGVIVMRSDLVDPKRPDPVYGDSLPRTWTWLGQKGGAVDFGIDGMADMLPSGEALAALTPRPKKAPVLLPAHLDAWVQTSPRPYPDPDVALWLHGPNAGAPEVQVVWRSDVNEAALTTAAGDDSDGAASLMMLTNRIAACPPVSLEALSVPIYAARAWLRGDPSPSVDDLINNAGAGDAGRKEERGLPALRWHGDQAEVVYAAQLRPGDTVVVPSARGGIRASNWDPECRDPVIDLGDLAQWQARGRAGLRMSPETLAVWQLEGDAIRSMPEWTTDGRALDPEAVATWLEDSENATGAHADAWSAISRLLRRRCRVVDLGAGYCMAHAPVRGRSEASTEGESGSFTARAVTLREHSRNVQNWVERFARGLGLHRELSDDLSLAAWLHDVGKADPRFQLWLSGGNPVRQAMVDEPLAKSAGSAQDRPARERARLRSGYPPGYRHEVLSTALVLNGGACEGAHDIDLVLHLIASHHGWCRPFAPALTDPVPVTVSVSHGDVELSGSTDHGLARLDSGVSDRFWVLVERYGWWGLAWMESILRLADHRASEEDGA